MADVFISYSRKDIQFAQCLRYELEARDREPWVAWQGGQLFSDGKRSSCNFLHPNDRMYAINGTLTH